MNKLLTFPGGQPFTTGDIDFVQDCYTSILNALAKGVCAEMDCILYGIRIKEANGSLTKISPGAVIIGGEIFVVPSEIKETNKYLCFRKTETENRTFADAEKHNVYLTYEPYLSATTEGAYKSIDIHMALTLRDIISQKAFYTDFSGCNLSPNVTGTVKVLQGIETTIRCELTKTANDSNMLFSYVSSRNSFPFVSMVVNVYDKKPYVVYADIGTCRVLNLDGTAFNGHFRAFFNLTQSF